MKNKLEIVATKHEQKTPGFKKAKAAALKLAAAMGPKWYGVAICKPESNDWRTFARFKFPDGTWQVRPFADQPDPDLYEAEVWIGGDRFGGFDTNPRYAVYRAIAAASAKVERLIVGGAKAIMSNWCNPQSLR